jgi:hypothetical protein
MVDNNLVVRPQALNDPPGLPIPEDDVSAARAGRDVFAVWRKTDLARVTRNGVPGEALLLSLLEAAVRGVDQDLIVKRLARKVFV